MPELKLKLVFVLKIEQAVLDHLTTIYSCPTLPLSKGMRHPTLLTTQGAFLCLPGGFPSTHSLTLQFSFHADISGIIFPLKMLGVTYL